MFRQSTTLEEQAHRLEPGSIAAEAVDYLNEKNISVVINPVQADYDLVSQLGELVAPTLPVHPAFAAKRSHRFYEQWRKAFPSSHMYLAHNAAGKLVSALCFEPRGEQKPLAEIWAQPPGFTYGSSTTELLSVLEAAHGFSAATTGLLNRGALMEITGKSRIIQTVCRDLGYNAVRNVVRDQTSGIDRQFMIVSPERIAEIATGVRAPEPQEPQRGSHLRRIK